MTTTDEGAWTEATDIEIDRVDLVSGAANGTQFLIRKASTDGLLKADEVAELIKEADATPVAKADDLDVSEPLAAGDGGSGSADAPGSPAWEADDAATARKWAAILARAKNAVQLLAARERTEAAVDDGGDDYANAWDLDDASCAIDAAISLLAPYALAEEMEVEFGTDSPVDEVTKAAISKAAKALDEDSSSLIVIESFGALRKAGRVLSQSNESAIRAAVDSLQGVLASLPSAPVAEEVIKTTEIEEAPVAKTAALEVEVTVADVLLKMLDGAPKLSAFDALQVVLAGGRTLAKAKGDAQLAVFDENGKLIGTVDPGDLSPIASSAAQATDAGADVADQTAAAPDAAAADAAPAAEAPAAPEAATVPGTATVQAPPPAAPHDEQQVTKANIAEAFGEVISPLAEQLPELVKGLADLRERFEKMSQRPDDRNSPKLYGATGEAGPAPRDGSAVDEFAPLQKAVDEATDPGAKRDALQALSYAKVRARFSS